MKKKNNKKKLDIHIHSDLGVIFKSSGCLSCSKIPQTEGFVPRSRQCIVSVRREDNVTDEVRVTLESLLGNSIVSVISGQLPDDQGVVWETNQLGMSYYLLIPEHLIENYLGNQKLTENITANEYTGKQIGTTFIYVFYVNLTSGARQDGVREFRVGGDLSDPSIVSIQSASKLESFSTHFDFR